MEPVLNTDEILSYCRSALGSAAGGYGGDLSAERSDAMDRYLGEPYGDEVPGRSQVITRDVLDSVEWMLPNLLELFLADKVVEFNAVSEEDEPVAEQETDVVNHVFLRECNGFRVLYDWFKDGLISKNGILKVWWDSDPQTHTEEYEGLDDFQLAGLSQNPQVEIISAEIEEMGWSVELRITDKPGQIRLEVIPPEDFRISGDASGQDIEKARFCAHVRVMPASDLIAMGFDRKTVDELPGTVDTFDEEDQARNHLSDEQNYIDYSIQHAARDVEVAECYLNYDINNDGITERIQVFLGGGAENGRILYRDGKAAVTEVQRTGIYTVCPVPLTHKFFGLSLADLTKDIQESKTVLLRQIIDNLEASNRGRMGANELVNLEDLLDNRTWGIVRSEGSTPVAQNLMQIQTPPVPAQTFSLLEYLDKLRRERSGVGEMLSGLDPETLSNMAVGTINAAGEMAKKRLALIARMFAESVKDVFLEIHRLLREHQDIPKVVKLRNEWVQVDPREWAERNDVTIRVGTGQSTRDQRLSVLAQIIALQERAAPFGVVMPDDIYESMSEFSRVAGEDDSYFTDPRTIPPQPPQPDPNMMMLQLQAQIEERKAQIEAFKAQSQAGNAEAEQERKRLELANKADMERMDFAMKSQKNETERLIAEAKIAFEQRNEEKDRQLEKYIADLKATVDLIKANSDLLGARVAGEPEKKGKAKRIEITTPSGEVYTGVSVEDDD